LQAPHQDYSLAMKEYTSEANHNEKKKLVDPCDLEIPWLIYILYPG